MSRSPLSARRVSLSCLIDVVTKDTDGDDDQTK